MSANIEKKEMSKQVAELLAAIKHMQSVAGNIQTNDYLNLHTKMRELATPIFEHAKVLFQEYNLDQKPKNEFEKPYNKKDFEQAQQNMKDAFIEIQQLFPKDSYIFKQIQKIIDTKKITRENAGSKITIAQIALETQMFNPKIVAENNKKMEIERQQRQEQEQATADVVSLTQSQSSQSSDQSSEFPIPKVIPQNLVKSVERLKHIVNDSRVKSIKSNQDEVEATKRNVFTLFQDARNQENSTQVQNDINKTLAEIQNVFPKTSPPYVAIQNFISPNSPDSIELKIEKARSALESYIENPNLKNNEHEQLHTAEINRLTQARILREKEQKLREEALEKRQKDIKDFVQKIKDFKAIVENPTTKNEKSQEIDAIKAKLLSLFDMARILYEEYDAKKGSDSQVKYGNATKFMETQTDIKTTLSEIQALFPEDTNVHQTIKNLINEESQGGITQKIVKAQQALQSYIRQPSNRIMPPEPKTAEDLERERKEEEIREKIRKEDMIINKQEIKDSFAADLMKGTIFQTNEFWSKNLTTSAMETAIMGFKQIRNLFLDLHNEKIDESRFCEDLLNLKNIFYPEPISNPEIKRAINDINRVIVKTNNHINAFLKEAIPNIISLDDYKILTTQYLKDSAETELATSIKILVIEFQKGNMDVKDFHDTLTIKLTHTTIQDQRILGVIQRLQEMLKKQQKEMIIESSTAKQTSVREKKTSSFLGFFNNSKLQKKKDKKTDNRDNPSSLHH